MTTFIIYALVDPRTEEIRYVGKTTQRVEDRIRAHLRDNGKCHRVNWLNELKAEGLHPWWVVLSRIDTIEPNSGIWQFEERWWISRLKATGAKLTNNTSGGDGVPDLPPETREKMRRVWLGRKHTQETKEKLRAARAKRVFSEETRAKMSKSQSGRVISWADKIAESVRKLSREEVEIVAQRIKNGEKVTDLAKELGMHRTSVSKIKAGTYFDKYKRKP